MQPEHAAYCEFDFINFSHFVQTFPARSCYDHSCPKGERQSSRRAEKPQDFFILLLPLLPAPLPQEPALFCPLRSLSGAVNDIDFTPWRDPFLCSSRVSKILHSGHIAFTLCPNQRHNPLVFCNHRKGDGFPLPTETPILFHKRFPLGNRSLLGPVFVFSFLPAAPFSSRKQPRQDAIPCCITVQSPLLSADRYRSPDEILLHAHRAWSANPLRFGDVLESVAPALRDRSVEISRPRIAVPEAKAIHRRTRPRRGRGAWQSPRSSCLECSSRRG